MNALTAIIKGEGGKPPEGVSSPEVWDRALKTVQVQEGDRILAGGDALPQDQLRSQAETLAKGDKVATADADALAKRIQRNNELSASRKTAADAASEFANERATARARAAERDVKLAGKAKSIRDLRSIGSEDGSAAMKSAAETDAIARANLKLAEENLNLSRIQHPELTATDQSGAPVVSNSDAQVAEARVTAAQAEVARLEAAQKMRSDDSPAAKKTFVDASRAASQAQSDLDRTEKLQTAIAAKDAANAHRAQFQETRAEVDRLLKTAKDNGGKLSIADEAALSVRMQEAQGHRGRAGRLLRHGEKSVD